MVNVRSLEESSRSTRAREVERHERVEVAEAHEGRGHVVHGVRHLAWLREERTRGRREKISSKIDRMHALCSFFFFSVDSTRQARTLRHTLRVFVRRPSARAKRFSTRLPTRTSPRKEDTAQGVLRDCRRGSSSSVWCRERARKTSQLRNFPSRGAAVRLFEILAKTPPVHVPFRSAPLRSRARGYKFTKRLRPPSRPRLPLAPADPTFGFDNSASLSLNTSLERPLRCSSSSRHSCCCSH